MFKRLSITFLFLFSVLNQANAVLPPKYYKEKIKNSEIKAFAVVEDIKITKWKDSIQSKKVSFKTIEPFTDNTPATFTGNCSSVKKKFLWDKGNQIDGGTIYYYPQKGEKAFVTVFKGYISSYSKINSNTEKESNKNGLKNIKMNLKSIKIKGEH